MFAPPKNPEILVYFGPVKDVAALHQGEDFSMRLEKEIQAHAGQIQAENLLLNTIAHYQHIAAAYTLPRDALNDILRDCHYHLDAARTAMIEKYDIPATAFTATPDIAPVDTADYMRQRAAMIGSVLSSTPVLLRDPWDGKPVTALYGFNDFKAEVDGIGFSAVATPRYKGIPFRFAVMKHEHDGFVDNNPAIIMSNEFCDAFALYHKERQGDAPATESPLLRAMIENLKPSIHDRFHNWLLYDIAAASETFKQWGDDIYFVEHADKNPLLINYEYVALCFHLYGYQTLFDKNPGMKDRMYDRLEECVAEINDFGAFLQQTNHPQATAIAESTLYAVLSNICFVLNPYEDRFQAIMAPFPDIRAKMLNVQDNGKGIGGTLQRLHSYEDGVPSQKYGGAREAAIEYILRYPLVDEIRQRLSAERENGAGKTPYANDGGGYTMNIESYERLPPALRDKAHTVRDADAMAKVTQALQALPEPLRQEYTARTEISEDGYFFFRMDRDELDYTQFEQQGQIKKVLLVDVPAGRDVSFTNEKRLSLDRGVKKQDFHLSGGTHVLAVNVRDQDAAQEILDRATHDGVTDPDLAVAAAKALAAMTGDKSASDLYKIERTVAARLYDFQGSGFYAAAVRKSLAAAPGPIIMRLQGGEDQRLIKGAFVYLPLGKDPADDSDPDCHLIENTDYKRDYDATEGTDALRTVRLKQSSPLAHAPGAEDPLSTYLAVLHEANFQITHGAAHTAQFFKNKNPHGPAGAPGLFS